AKTAPAAGRVTGTDSSSVEHMKSILANNNCLVCHKVGTDGGDIAPSLNGVGTRRTAEQIRAAIVSPPAKTSAGAANPMPSYKGKLTEDELKNLVHYLGTLPSTP
ncbi:MAG TPA: c-type cytochrome, partial [Acidobacteriaceae bacterium]|nr:c-type cytochrome [Acidobacteriaceae bacterium]